MEKFNSFISTYKNQIYFSLAVILMALGVYIGFKTVDQFQIIVNAALGITVLYLLYDKFFSHGRINNQLADNQVKLPQDLKKLVYAFIGTIIGFWATAQVVRLVYYLINILMGLFDAS